MGEQTHTVFASQAISLADMFKYSVGKHRLDGTPAYVPELSVPDGPSTAGGKQALQHLTLSPVEGGPSLAIGTVHLVEKRVDLRTFKAVDDIHRQRFKGQPFTVQQPVYEGLLNSIRDFFSKQEYRVMLSDGPPSRTVRAPVVAKLPPKRPKRMILTVALTAASVVAAAITIVFLRR